MSNPSFEHKCKRCDYEWLGKLENPKACPKCNSPYWNKERARMPFHRVQYDETALDTSRAIQIPTTARVAWQITIDSTSKCSKCGDSIMMSDVFQVDPKAAKIYCEKCAEYS